MQGVPHVNSTTWNNTSEPTQLSPNSNPTGPDTTKSLPRSDTRVPILLPHHRSHLRLLQLHRHTHRPHHKARIERSTQIRLHMLSWRSIHKNPAVLSSIHRAATAVLVSIPRCAIIGLALAVATSTVALLPAMAGTGEGPDYDVDFDGDCHCDTDPDNSPG